MKHRKQMEREYQELKARVARLKQAEAELEALAPPSLFAAEVASLRAKLKLPRAVEEVERELRALRRKVLEYRQAEAARQAEAREVPVPAQAAGEGMPFLPPLELPGYILTGRIGSGAFAEVYRAQRREDGRAVAVKLPRVDALETFQPREFLQEAELWSRLKHPYIVSVQEWGLKPVPWIAMELMEGGSLRQRLSRLTARESLEIGVKLAEALYYAHHLGVIHRDIKPQNILFDRQNTPKLSDWGLGKVMLHASRSASGFKGTLAYAAPEQLSSDLGEPDWRTDIYQLAAVLYEMVTGQLPCGGEPGWILTREVRPPRQLNPALPARLDGILLKALDRRKERRYRDVSLLGEELERLLQQG